MTGELLKATRQLWPGNQPAPKSTKALIDAIDRHTKAQIALSWSGAGHPADLDSIELEAERAQQALALLLAREAFA